MLLEYTDGIRNTEIKPRKKLQKLGTLCTNVVETTPVVFHGELLIFMWMRPKTVTSFSVDGSNKSYYTFWSCKNDTYTPPFAEDYCFGSCYCEDDTMYVIGGKGEWGSRTLDIFSSKDLVNWDCRHILDIPLDATAYNTSFCKCDDGYALAIEFGGHHELIGHNYTNFFAKSPDLKTWEFLPLETHVHTPKVYSACPVLRFVDGQFYMIYLENLGYQRYTPLIVRSRDLEYFELAIHQPFMMFDDDEDKKLLYPERFSENTKHDIAVAVDCNNSDVDLCEFEGKTYITYSWGNQHGRESLALATYDGSMAELLKSYFNE